MHFIKIISLAFLLQLQSFGQQIAILGAMPEEIEELELLLKHKKEKTIGGVKFSLGKIGISKVVICKSGVGKVNAAYTTTLLLENFKISKIIFTGVAGGTHPESAPGDIVLATQLFHHDYVWHLGTPEVRATRNITSGNDNPLFFKSDSLLLKIAKENIKNTKFEIIEGHLPRVFVGTIATGDAFINNADKAKYLFTTFDAYATEMEGAAIAQIAYIRKTPFLIIRSISDNANHNAEVSFDKFVKPAARNAIKVVQEILNSPQL
jgi:adenosylhomocysteine nucleosidase